MSGEQTRQVNIHEAKTHLSRLLEQVEAGGEVVIARGGTPVAKLVAVGGAPRRLGRLAGKIEIADDFDAPLPDDVLASFDGSA